MISILPEMILPLRWAKNGGSARFRFIVYGCGLTLIFILSLASTPYRYRILAGHEY